MMNIYRVGGAVRDALLGLPVQDVDYVVIGSTPEEMIAAGYTPVGKDFPVFLHPISKAEYALARTERKSAPGYHGFVFHCAPDVTLEQDLQRRDLTINAMAIADNAAAPNIIDPFGGQRDLAAKIFRHVSDAFAEDPVRILRVARFAARFEQFTVAPETMQLMRAMVVAGEADALVPERVWQEIARGLMELHPSRMLTVLHECGALARIIPEFESTWSAEIKPDSPILSALDCSALQGQALEVRWATACIAWSDTVQQPFESAPLLALCQRLKVPAEVRDIALIACREQSHIYEVNTLSARQVVELLERCDAIRRPSRFVGIMSAVRCAYLLPSVEFPQQSWLDQALSAIRSVPAGAIAQEASQQFPGQKDRIAAQIFAARVAAVESLT